MYTIIKQNDLVEIINKKICYKLKHKSDKNNFQDFMKIEIDGKKFFFATYIELLGDKSDKNLFVELAFDDYIETILRNEEVEGIAIALNEDYLLIRQYHLQWMKIKKKQIIFFETIKKKMIDEKIREEKIYEYDELLYEEHLENIKALWIKRLYEEMYEYLSLLRYEYSHHVPEFLYYIAKIYEKMGNNENAELYYREAIRHQCDNYWLYYELVLYYKRNDMFDKAVEVCKTAYKQHRFNQQESNSDEGIVHILNELLDYAVVKKRRIEKGTYISYLNKVKKSSGVNNEKKCYSWINKES